MRTVLLTFVSFLAGFLLCSLGKIPHIVAYDAGFIYLDRNFTNYQVLSWYEPVVVGTNSAGKWEINFKRP